MPPVERHLAKSAHYREKDYERYVAEAPKGITRTDFERDRARILHSAALRRLGAKTQVLGPSQDDFVRTRLTHSLEVAQVGRGIGAQLGCDPDIVDAASLAHDLGHPPFGHNGEKALAEVAAEIGGFEGNAQTFRVVTRLETKVLSRAGEPAGLNLTRATLDAISKYPWPQNQGPTAKSARKYGVYQDDLEVFTWMREDAPPGRRCLEAQIMDLSDDIGYCVHDFEDAVVTGCCDIGVLAQSAELDKIIESTVSWYGEAVSADHLVAAAKRLLETPFWFDDYDGSYRGRALLKDLTSQLIGRFCDNTVRATRAMYGTGPLGRYDADLVIPAEVHSEILILKGIAAHYVMEPRELEPVFLRQRTVIKDLAAALFESGPNKLEEPLAEQWRAADTDVGRLRAVVDQIASLTDVSAHRWHGQLCGIFSEL